MSFHDLSLFVAVVPLVTMLLFASGCQRSSSPMNGDRFPAGLAAYARDLRSRGEQIPNSVSLDNLVRLGYLTAADAQPFEGVKLVFHSDADETHPQKILVDATMRDGTQFAVMGDGSVQQFPIQTLKEALGQPGGAANRSQPVGSQTNGTSAAAGSGR